VTSALRAEVVIWPFRACAMHLAIITETVRSLWTWLWGRYHAPQNIFLVATDFRLLAVMTKPKSEKFLAVTITEIISQSLTCR